ncbi:hydrogenase maturation protease [Ammonifex degensii KC4]|uniref:Hydrogenase maturation protease n=1 Tax=Ammonifex degensii (strain DSM 10501 / KC4) TaxID=429009 RepID=C9R7R5_AMMDK|nr:HyaD/HybD family hydrogenase maturation endopeptidase [Ammonifex degensii]ACX52344.1 hydrogenase maturation protease [Ammonifex degensii KC4]
MEEREPKLTVLGIGNLLLQDEGLGIHAVRELQKFSYPPVVEILDGGTAGIDLLYYIEDSSRLIIIDAVNGQAPPGTIFKFSPDELDDYVPVAALSSHSVGILEVIYLAKVTGVLPPTTIFGMQPASMAWGMELSPVIKERLPRLISLVDAEIREWLRRSFSENEGITLEERG